MKANELFEITHDSLAAKIWDKISAEEQELMEVNNILASEYKAYKQRGNLLSQKDLATIALYEHKLNLDEDMARFVNRSKNFYQKRRVVLRTLVGVILLLCFVVIILQINKNTVQNSLLQTARKNENDKRLALEKAEIAVIKQVEALENLESTNNMLGKTLQALELEKKKADEERDKAVTAKMIADRARSDAVEAKNSEIQNTEQTAMTLAAIKLLQDDPTASLRQSLNIYNSITVPGLKRTLRRNVYRAFEEILYQQELKFRNPVIDVAVHPDMKYIIVADNTNNPKLWNVKSGIIKPLIGHQGLVTALAISTDGKNFLSVENNRSVIFWNEEGNYNGYKTFDRDIADIKFLGKKKQVLIGFKDGTLAVLNASGNINNTINKKLLDIKQILVSNNYAHFDFVTLSSDNKVRIWRKEDNKKKEDKKIYTPFELQLKMNINKVESICLSLNNSILGLGTDKGFYLFELKRKKDALDTSRLVLDSSGLIASRSIPFISDISFRNNEDLILTTSTGLCFNYNVLSKQTKEAHGHKPEKKINRIATTSDSKYFITASNDCTVKIWNASQGRIYSFATKQFNFSENYQFSNDYSLSDNSNLSDNYRESGNYYLSNKEGSLRGYQFNKRWDMHLTPSGRMDSDYKFSLFEKNIGDLKVKTLGDQDSLEMTPIIKNRRGLEVVTGIHLKDGMDTVKTISARNSIIYRAAFSDDGVLIMIQKNDIGFSNVNYEIYPTFYWILKRFNPYFKSLVYED